MQIKMYQKQQGFYNDDEMSSELQRRRAQGKRTAKCLHHRDGGRWIPEYRPVQTIVTRE